jgi:hypothetical protein
MSQLVHDLTAKNEGSISAPINHIARIRGASQQHPYKKIHLNSTKKSYKFQKNLFADDQIFPAESGLSKPIDAAVEPLGPLSSKNVKSSKEKKLPKNQRTKVLLTFSNKTIKEKKQFPAANQQKNQF